MFSRTFQFTALLLTGVIAVSCSGGNTPAYNPDIGPFDEDGNYVEAWADNPPKRGSGRRSPDPEPAPKPEPRIAKRPTNEGPAVNRPQPPPTVKVQPKPKPKPVVAKAKPKPKPKPAKPKTIRHLVKKGDTLYGLSQKYGTSVSAIKRANNISGTTIITGKSYLIPR